MGLRTSKSVIALRNFTRKLGIKRLFMRAFGSSTSEDKFNQVLLASGCPGDLVWEVIVRRGDQLVAAGAAAVPQFIKIDVEGFEWEVLQGLGQILGNPALRALGIEVHFGLLAERGMADVPNRIEQLLQSVGFSCQWPDSSHILATRPA